MTLGDWGYLSIITALVFSVCASISYFRVLLGKGEQKEWLINARGTFLLHTAGVAGAWIVLLILVFSHRYDYSYVWEHVSNELPWYFVLSSIWEGKQGSFLLWVFWHSMIGVVFITAFRRNHQHHAGVMAILSALQAMLLAMVLGVVIPGTGITIGDSPFLTLKQATQSPIFEQNPNFVPNNGNGLNILLQNVWMAIHPPIIFMGYAVAGVAFGYALQALISQRYKTWVPSMMFWNTAAVFMIGTGILMGSWWAYETLNFGGYWSWDPVENAVLIPWLVLLAGLHALLRFNQKNKGLKLALALPLAGYIMIVYASFLTVSGILGEASVHSFTDSGLKGQLALWLLTIIAVPVALFAIRWKDISFETRNENTHSKADLWMVMGVVVLLLAAFQLLMPLSIPIFNKFSQWLGGSGNLAPPAEPMQFYGKFQLWFAIAIAALSAWVQQYYMAKSKKVDQQNVFFIAAAASLLATGIYVLITRDLQVQYWIYTAAAVFTLVVNTQLVVNFMKNGKTRLVAGAVAHVGMGIFLLGILFSSVMDEVITKNDFAAKENGREHALLVQGEMARVGNYKFQYDGEYKALRNYNQKVSLENLYPTHKPHTWVLGNDIQLQDGKTLPSGKQVETSLTGSIFKIQIVKGKNDTTTVYPSMKQEASRKNAVFSPHIIHKWNKDIFLHVSNLSDNNAKGQYRNVINQELKTGEVQYIKGMRCKVKAIESVDKIPGAYVFPDDDAYKVRLKFTNKAGHTFSLEPYILYQKGEKKVYEDKSSKAGIGAIAKDIDLDKQRVKIAVADVNKKWITIQAIEKPGIALYWAGGIIMLLGLLMAAIRRGGVYVSSLGYILSNKTVNPAVKASNQMVLEKEV